MSTILRTLAVVAALAASVMIVSPSQAAEKTHHIVFHIDQNDKAAMDLLLNNVENVMEYYQGKGEGLEVEVVAYGPGLMMLRDDKSPVKARLASLKKVAFPSKLTYSACGVTLGKMEKKEGHKVPIVAEARVVPGGVVRLTELQEQGWAYIKP